MIDTYDIIGDTLKVEFLENDKITVQLYSNIDISDRSNLGVFLKEIGIYLKKKYDYLFDGLYDVEAFQYSNYFIFEIEKVEEYPAIDFNISFHPNRRMLMEFDDEDYINGCKYFYNGKYYVDFELASHYLNCFEFCNVIYSDDVEKILREARIVF